MRIPLFWLAAILVLYGCGEARLNQKKKHFLHKGNIAYKEKLYDEAIRYYRSALELDPKFAQAYNNLGIVYLGLEKYDEATLSFDACIESDPEFTEAYFNRSTASYALGDYYRSLEDLNHIQPAYQSEESIHFSKGLAFTGLGKYDSAELHFTAALQADSTNIETLLNLATVKYYQQQYAEAQSLLDESMKIDPRSAIALNLYGLIKSDQGDYTGAIGYFNRGISLKSNDAFLFNNRGFAYLMTGQPDKALQDINKSILINPDNAWAYRNKGIYYFLIEHWQDAERLLLQSVRMEGGLTLSYYYLGQIYLETQRSADACQAFEKSMEVGDKEGEKAYRTHCR